jgi:hypothetical protein
MFFIEQRKMLALPVNVHQKCADFPQQAARYSAPVDPQDGAPLTAKLAVNHKVVFFNGYAFFFKKGPESRPGGAFRDKKYGFDTGAVGTKAYAFFIQTDVEQCLDGIDDKRFAGTGFTGDDVEAAG